jgi:hypothetical protein
LIFGGVLRRHPALRVISVEAYIGWLPFVAEYIDHAYRVHRYWNDLGLDEPPSAYLRRQVYATFIDDPVGLRERHAFGVDNILWSRTTPTARAPSPTAAPTSPRRSPASRPRRRGRWCTRTPAVSIACSAGTRGRRTIGSAVRGSRGAGSASIPRAPAD